MPEGALTPDRRRVAIDPDTLAAPPRAAFVELGVASCFSFLRGASDAVDLVMQARALGYDAIGIADANSLAGVVRIHTEAATLKLRPVIGCRIETVEGLAFLAYPTDRAGYGRLCALVSAGRMAKPGGEWQDKGVCEITLAMLADHAEGVQLVLIPPADLAAEFDLACFVYPSHSREGGNPSPDLSPKARPEMDPRLRGDDENRKRIGTRLHLRLVPQPPPTGRLAAILPHLAQQLPSLRHIAAAYLYAGDDIARIAQLDALARDNGLSILATNDVLYHAPDRRPLQDVMTAIRHKTTVAKAGFLLQANAERRLKSPQEMARLFEPWPHAIAAAREVADACRFSLDELRYEYPEEICPDGLDPQGWLEQLTWEGADRRYPGGVPESVRDTLIRELALIAKLALARYFLTIKDIVDFARGQDPPILCQGARLGGQFGGLLCAWGSRRLIRLQTRRFCSNASSARNASEPPDIDVDFEHERREEVIQHIYRRKYGRHRGGPLRHRHPLSPPHGDPRGGQGDGPVSEDVTVGAGAKPSGAVGAARSAGQGSRRGGA